MTAVKKKQPYASAPVIGSGLASQMGTQGPTTITGGAWNTGVPKPPAAAAPAGAAAPPDPAYQARLAALAKQRDQTIAALTQARQQGLLQYGYTQGSDGSLAFDATNPFSQAALLKTNYDQARAGNTTSMAARGQLYAGSLQNAQNETGRQQQVGENQLQQAMLTFLAQNQQGIAQAGTDYELGASDALGTSTANAANNPLYSPAVDTSPVAAAQAAAAGNVSVAPGISQALASTWSNRGLAAAKKTTPQLKIRLPKVRKVI